MSSWTAKLRPHQRGGPKTRTAGRPAAAARPGLLIQTCRCKKTTVRLMVAGLTARSSYRSVPSFTGDDGEEEEGQSDEDGQNCS